MKNNIKKLFNKIDKNKDGKLTAAEIIIAIRKNPEISKVLNLPKNIR